MIEENVAIAIQPGTGDRFIFTIQADHSVDVIHGFPGVRQNLGGIVSGIDADWNEDGTELLLIGVGQDDHIWQIVYSGAPGEQLHWGEWSSTGLLAQESPALS